MKIVINTTGYIKQKCVKRTTERVIKTLSRLWKENSRAIQARLALKRKNILVVVKAENAEPADSAVSVIADYGIGINRVTRDVLLARMGYKSEWAPQNPQRLKIFFPNIKEFTEPTNIKTIYNSGV